MNDRRRDEELRKSREEEHVELNIPPPFPLAVRTDVRKHKLVKPEVYDNPCLEESPFLCLFHVVEPLLL
jgi:hypothetical protein